MEIKGRNTLFGMISGGSEEQEILNGGSIASFSTLLAAVSSCQTEVIGWR